MFELFIDLPGSPVTAFPSSVLTDEEQSHLRILQAELKTRYGKPRVYETHVGDPESRAYSLFTFSTESKDISLALSATTRDFHFHLGMLIAMVLLRIRESELMLYMVNQKKALRVIMVTTHKEGWKEIKLHFSAAH